MQLPLHRELPPLYACGKRLPLAQRRNYISQVPRRVCYIHIGPHKTGTTSIQAFLKENRSTLLKQGYFVPETRNVHGGHHLLARQLCGLAVPQHHQETAARFATAIRDITCEAVVISSESLDSLLLERNCARNFFSRMEEHNLEPKIVFFPRNQSQLLNSRYTQVVKGFERSESFETFVQADIRHRSYRYSDFIALADAFRLKLIAAAFTEDTLVRGVVIEFLKAIGIAPSQFQDTKVRRNPGAGPFTVGVARCLLRSLGAEPRGLTWLQASECRRMLAAYLKEKELADSGYSGLTTALARHIEAEWQTENDAFALAVWDTSWAEMFASDVGRNFEPNDFDLRPPPRSMRRQLECAIREMQATIQQILRDPALSIRASWNDLRRRASGFTEESLH